MSTNENEFDARLLDLHLERLPDEEQAELRQRIQSDPALSLQHEALAEMFTALRVERDDEPPLPAGLAERISARVAAAGASPRIVSSPRRDMAKLAELADPGGIIRMRGFRDIAAVAAMIVLAVGLGVPSLLHVRERAQRTMCTQNLASIGTGLQSYALANSYSLPFAGWGSDNTWRPTEDPTLKVLPNRRHVYPLVRAGHVPTSIFICPSTRGLPMAEDQARVRDDFIESRNLSYAYQNMAGKRPSMQDSPDLPILGDDNPLFDNGWPLFDSLGLTDPAEANSRAHGGAGQNILTIRGSVRWMTSPAVGIDNDNIWTLENVDEYTGREGPQSTDDAHLLK